MSERSAWAPSERVCDVRAPGATTLAFGPVTPIAPLNVLMALAYAVAPAAESVMMSVGGGVSCCG